MPLKIYTKKKATEGSYIVATEEDKVLLIKANTQPPGIRGLLTVPNDRVFALGICAMSLFIYACVMFDFTVVLTQERMIYGLRPLTEGTLRYFIFCMDFIFLTDVVLSICHRYAGQGPKRNIFIILVDIVSLLPFEMVYGVLHGKDVRVYHALRMRYLLRLSRYFMEMLHPIRDRLSVAFTIGNYALLLLSSCSMLTFFRVHIYCFLIAPETTGTSVIKCRNLTVFDIATTYSLIMGQVTFSGVLFVNDAYLHITYVDNIVHVVSFMQTVRLFSNLISIIIENNQYKYTFCLAGERALQAMRSECQSNQYMKKQMVVLLRQYMASYWQHYQIENLQKNYVADYKVATIPSVVQAEITLDITWDMFKHSLLFQNQDVAFLRQISKLVILVFGTKGSVIYQQYKPKSIMIYIISGIVSLVDETTGRTVLMSFSAGSVFGEAALFMNVSSAVTLSCSTYCQYLVLPRRSFLQLKTIYPSAYRKLRSKCYRRVEYAKNYDLLARLAHEKGDVKLPKSKLSLRYIKVVLRYYMRSPEEPLRKTIFIPDYMKPDAPFASTIFNARYIPLYVEADKFDSDFLTHFNITGLNFKIKESSTIVTVWRFVVSLITLVDCLVFPLGASQDAAIFTTLYDFQVIVVHIFYFLDFISWNYISLKMHGHFVNSSTALFNISIQKVSFWLDFVASIPIAATLTLMQAELHPYVYRLLGLNRLIKIYKVMNIIHKTLIFSKFRVIAVLFAQTTYVFFILIFFGMFTFHRFGYFRLYNIDTPVEEMTFWSKINLVYQFTFSMAEVPMKVDRNVNFIPMIIYQIGAFYILVYSICSHTAVYSLLYMPIVNRENLVDDMKRILFLYEFPIGPRMKMARYLKVMDNNHTLEDEITHDKMMGKVLYKEHCINLNYNHLCDLPLFKLMDTRCLFDICKIAKVSLVPRGDLMVIAGSIVTHIYILLDGHCEYTLKKSSITLKSIGIGYAILLIEGLLGHKALTNVITQTDCRVLAIEVRDLRRILIKHQFEGQAIMSSVVGVVEKQHLGQSIVVKLHLTTIKQMSQKEPRALPLLQDNESCRYFGSREFKSGFNKARVLMVLFMRRSITPYGRFWFIWEITHIMVAFTYCIFGCLPVTVNCNFNFWFFFFRLLDAFFLLDIYLRHHMIYYNSSNVEVQHPWYCAKHYWQTNFILDFIGTIPLELLVLPFIKQIDILHLSFLRLNRHVRLWRFYGLRKYIQNKYMRIYKMDAMICYTCGSLLVFNLIVQFMGRREIVPIQNGSPVLETTEIQFWDAYLGRVYIGMKHWCLVGMYEGLSDRASLTEYVLMNLAGRAIWLTIVNIIISMSLFRRMHLVTFQVKMQRLVAFFGIRKIDKNITHEVIRHYEHVWALREGKELTDALHLFNETISEEVIASYYAFLQKTVLFMNYPKVLKYLLSSPYTKRELILIRGVIVRVNNVHNKIYIVYKGIVQVLGPDCSYLRDLRAGSLFGCLDNVSRHRSTLTYIAKTHCEFLTIPSTEFHMIMSIFPRNYQLYKKILKSSNFDYIPGGMTIRETESETSLSTVAIAENVCGAFLAAHFPVWKRREYFKKLTAVYIVLSFQFEVMNMTVLHKHFNFVVYIAYAIDLLFWFKMYVDLSTEYEDQYGIKIRDRKLIARKYLTEYLGAIFHLLVNLPFELFVFAIPNIDHPYYWSYLRFNRLFKLILVFSYIHSVKNRLNVKVGIIKTFDLLLIIYTLQQIGIILLSFVGVQDFYWEVLILESYFISKKVYTPFKRYDTRTYADNSGYKFTSLCILFLTQIICIISLADLVATYNMVYFERFRYEVYLRDEDHVMKSMKVSPPLHNRVKKYCRSLEHAGNYVQIPHFIINAPYYLKESVMDAMFGVHLRNHPLFKLCHVDFIRQLAASLKTLYFFEGDYIAFQGDIDMKMYFIHYGVVEGLVEDNVYFELADSKYLAGEYFGLHQIIYTNVGHVRTYKVVSKTALVVAVKRGAVIPLLDFFPATKHLFYNTDAPNDDLDRAGIELRDYLNYTKSMHE